MHYPETGEIGIPKTGLYFRANEYPKIIKEHTFED